MAQIGVSSAPALELRVSSFTDATLIRPPLTRPPETPHSFSYLLSMQDMSRYTSDSPACSSSSDHDFEFSEFPCSATDHDRSLMETISEDDRAALLPIIRIAFPSLRYSLKDHFTPWHIAAGDQMMETLHDSQQPNEVAGSHRLAQPNEVEDLHLQPVDYAGSIHENEPEVNQYHFIPMVSSTIEEVRNFGGFPGVQSGEKLKHQLATQVGVEMGKGEKTRVAEDLRPHHRLYPGASNITNDKLCLSIASCYGGSNLRTDIPIGTYSLDHVEKEASRTGRVQRHAARPANESSEFFHDQHLGSGPSSIDSGSPHLETTSSKCSEGADQSHASQSLGASQVQTCNTSEHIASSDAEERAAFGGRLDLACGSSRTNEIQKDSVTESASTSPATLSDVNHFKFPEVNRRKRNIIKKAVGWVGKTKITESFCETSSFRRICGSASFTGCEGQTKKRRLSANSPLEVSPSSLFSALPEDQSGKIAEQDKVVRKVDTMTDLNSRLIEMDASPVGKELACMTPEWVDPLLSNALFLLVFEAGDNGVSVCEALRKLLRRGYSKLFISNSQPRAVQVKMALKRCPDFKELDSCRFVLRNSKCSEDMKDIVQLASDEQSKGEATCQKPVASGRSSEELTPKSVTVSSTALKCDRQEENLEQCGKTDGKQCCSHEVQYCENHYQCQSRAGIQGYFDEDSHLDTDGQKLPSSHTEEESQTVADSCSGQSRERSQGDEFKLNRCRRTDGRHWQCSKQAKPDSIYCEHHQGRRKKVKSKGTVPNPFTAPRGSNQELQFTEAWSTDSTVPDAKKKAKANAHLQVRTVKELKQGLLGSNVLAMNMTPIGWNGSLKGNYNTQSAVLQEMKLEQDLNLSEPSGLRRPQTGARILMGKSNSNCYGETRVTEAVKREIPGLNMGTLARHTTVTHSWEGRDYNRQAVGTEQLCHVAVDTSHSAVNSCKGKVKSKVYGQITKDRDGSQDQAINACSLLRLTAASNGYNNAEKCADDEGADGIHLERCHRKDGKQWQCSKRCRPGQIYCDHHQGRRLKSKANVQAKVANPKEVVPQAKVGVSLFGGNTLHYAGEQSQGEISKMTDDCSHFGEAELQGLNQCHRKDGKGWRCSRPVQHGFNYCDHHQVYLSNRTSPKVPKRETENCTSSNTVKIWSDMLTIRCSPDS